PPANGAASRAVARQIDEGRLSKGAPRSIDRSLRPLLPDHDRAATDRPCVGGRCTTDGQRDVCVAGAYQVQRLTRRTGESSRPGRIDGDVPLRTPVVDGDRHLCAGFPFRGVLVAGGRVLAAVVDALVDRLRGCRTAPLRRRHVAKPGDVERTDELTLVVDAERLALEVRRRRGGRRPEREQTCYCNCQDHETPQYFPLLGDQALLQAQSVAPPLSSGSPFWVNFVDRKDSAPRAPVDSGAKHHLRSRRLQGRRGMRGRCNGPAPCANRGVGLFPGAAESIFFSNPSFRRWGRRGRHRRSTYGFSLHMRRDCKQGARKTGAKTPQRASFARCSTHEFSRRGIYRRWSRRGALASQ